MSFGIDRSNIPTDMLAALCKGRLGKLVNIENIKKETVECNIEVNIEKNEPRKQIY